MKKLLSLILATTLAFSLVGCGGGEAASNEGGTTDSNSGTESTPSAASEIYPEEKVLIGVELYDLTESETLAIQDYFSYLAETYNVEFKYSEAIQDADQEMKFIEDCAIAGCKGFFGYYNVTGVEQINKVLEYDMYYYGSTTSYNGDFKDNPKFIGAVTANGSDYELGQSLGNWVVEQGFDTVVYANGGADFGVPIFVDRQNGFLEAVGDTAKVITVSGFPNDQFFADQAAALTTPELDAVVASFNGVDFWAQPMASAGLTDVQLGTIGAVNESYLNAFEGGSLSYLVAGNIQGYGFVVSTILNAVDGNGDAFRENGEPIAYNVPSFEITSAEELAKILEVQNGEKIFTAEDFKDVIVHFNPEANLQTLKDLADSGSKENILAR